MAFIVIVTVVNSNETSLVLADLKYRTPKKKLKCLSLKVGLFLEFQEYNSGVNSGGMTIVLSNKGDGAILAYIL